MRKGIFIEGITAEMFRNGSLEAVEALIAEGECVDMETPQWTPCSEKMPEDRRDVLVTCFIHENWQTKIGYWNGDSWVISAYEKRWIDELEVTAWMPMPKPYNGEE